MNNIKPGDKVEWESSYKVKSGVMVAFVPAGESADQYLPEGIKKSHRKYDHDRSSLDRALCMVPSGAGELTNLYYAPRFSLVHLKQPEKAKLPISKAEAEEAASYIFDLMPEDEHAGKMLSSVMKTLNYILECYGQEQ